MSIDKKMSERDYNVWYVDNGATNHVTFRQYLFQTFQPFVAQKTVTTANGDIIKALGKGSIEVKVEVNGNWTKVTLENMWYVPNIKKNLFSVFASQDMHLNSEFVSKTEICQLKVNKKVVLVGSRCRRGGLYRLNVDNIMPTKTIEVSLLTKDENLLQIYHERMGHQNKKHVKATVERELGIKLTLNNELCEGCIYGKSHRLKFGTRERAKTPGE